MPDPSKIHTERVGRPTTSTTTSASGRRRGRTTVRALTVVALVLSSLTLLELGTPATASAAMSPVVESGAGHVTSDALPTVQVNGVVWDQTIIGNTVYAVGEFTSARPAGSPLGTNETPRSNILAYDITTGNLITSFAPTLNRQARTITSSPDGTRLFVGGDFTSVSGLNRYRIVALNPTSGAVITGFDAIVDYQVKVLVATNTTLYAGGGFNYAGTGNANTRSRLAAFSAVNGAVLPWAPAANSDVHSMVMGPDGSKVFVGGKFTTINGATAYGLAAIDATTGALIPWDTNNVVRDAGANSAVVSLSTDGTSIFGTGYAFGKGGNLEGSFSADPNTGAINWVSDCHGDTYDGAPINGYFYTVGHAHYCGNVGGFPQSNPWTTNMRHAKSTTINATGTIGREPWGYTNWFGTPSPSLNDWFPEWTVGTYTGQDQATWTITGNSNYVVVGGEFLKVNNTGQQSLVRFAVKPIAPATDGPRLTGANYPINVKSTATGTARISFPANYDRDNMRLTYKLSRDGNTGSPIYQTTVDSTFWDRPTIGFTDTGLTPGQTYTYRVFVYDPDGNHASSETTGVTVAATGSPSPYSDAVMADGARMHWRLGEGAGSATAADAVTFHNATVGSQVTLGAAGALLNDTNTAATVRNSISSTLVDPTITDTYDTVSVEAWVKTNSNSGGRILGFSDKTSGTSSSADRVLYMANNGRILFGANYGSKLTIESPSGFNNNQWHHVVGTLGADGMHLYVDGIRVASRGDVMGGGAYNGYWRVGADTLSGWTSRPTNDYLAGSIDEPAVYYSVLTPTQVANHYTASGRTVGLPAGPADSYGASIRALDPYLYYRLAETSGSTANDTGIRANTGDYVGTVGRNATGVIAGNAAAQFGGNGFVASRTSVYNPTNYSAETWFNTTTATGGALLSFGNSRTTTASTTTDRQVYMRNDGRLVFTVKGGASTITTTNALNDGQWHHVAATQGANGTALYVDGVLVGTTPQQQATAFYGYWRIGGDATNGGSTSNNFNGRLDEAAIYDKVLTPAQVTNHFLSGGGQLPNVAPTAAFTSSTSFLTANVDGTSSSDSDGTVASYAWNFGDGATGTGPTASHAYAATGTYTVTLTVTDDDGATNVVTHDVSVVANQAPTAAFTSSTSFLTANVNGSSSSDSDGTVASYAWNFGDGATGTGPTASHTYATAGTYSVTLTVTDNIGATGTLSKDVTVAANQAPTAAFSTSAQALVVTANGTGSTDADGTIASYAWNFGDGATGTGSSSSHAYAAAGTYTITLTVTDNAGATGTLSKDVTVAGAVVYANDTYTRTATNGFGTAETGGNYTLLGTAANFSVSNGQARMVLPSAGVSRAATLYPAGALDAESTVDFTLDKAPTANGTYVGSVLRKVGNSEYRLRVRVRPGITNLQMLQVVNNVETQVGTLQTISGVNYTPGMVVHLKFRATGSGTTTLQGKVWFDSATEPANWQIQTTDSTAALQNAGGVGVHAYISGASTEVPVTVTVDNFKVKSPFGDPVNVAPTAAFTSSNTFLAAAFNGSGSTDSDGTIASYAWNFGDSTTGTGPTANHTYAAAGTYTVTLTVTDNSGATGTVSHDVTVAAAPPANVAPTAAFTSSTDFLAASVDGGGSTDSDGTIASYAWNFGDSTTGTGPTANHTYAAAGTYTVTLTVTDDDGATGTVSHDVTVTAAPQLLVSDLFERTVVNGLGASDVGGSWSLSGTASNFSVNGGQGRIKLTAAGISQAASLNGTTQQDSDTTVDFALDKVPTDGGVFMGLSARKVGNSEYRLRVRVRPTVTNLELVRVVGGVETTVSSQVVTGAIYTAGTPVHVRFRVTGNGTTTLAGKAWFGDSPEPATFPLQFTDTTASLQVAGSTGVHAYVSGTVANAPLVLSVDNLKVSPTA